MTMAETRTMTPQEIIAVYGRGKSAIDLKVAVADDDYYKQLTPWEVPG